MAQVPYSIVDNGLNDGKIQDLFSGLSQTIILAMIGSVVIGGVGRVLPDVSTYISNGMDKTGEVFSYAGYPLDWLAHMIGGGQ